MIEFYLEKFFKINTYKILKFLKPSKAAREIIAILLLLKSLIKYFFKRKNIKGKQI